MSELQQARVLAFPNQQDTKSAARVRTPVSSDPNSLRVQQQLQKLARADIPVLLVGETGTGKELAARHLHEHSGRQGPFVAVNCGALSEHLIEAELFGHEAGAFTGAQHSRAGWFETAHGGTLFLDEIGDMPLALQVRLLRVLQEKQVVRVGARKSIPINVRVVAATNVDLARAVEAGKFRKDLYYRLNAAAVSLPPLKKRRADILTLARHFVEVYRRELGLGEIRLTESAEHALLTHDWPGNIRELENVVHYGLILCDGVVLEAADLRMGEAIEDPRGADTSRAADPVRSGGADPKPDARANAAADHTADAANADAADAADADAADAADADAADADAGLHPFRSELIRLLRSGRGDMHELVERVLVTTAFEVCDRNQVRTAKRLGLSRNVVRAQLMRHGLLSSSRRLPKAGVASERPASPQSISVVV